MGTVIERGNEHEKGTFGQMKVGDKGVHGFEAVAGVDEDARVTRKGTDRAVRVGDAFECAAGRRSNADDAAARAATLVDDARAFLGNREKLGVHDVFVQAIDLYGAERPQTHVEHHGCDRNAHGADLFEQFGRKVQPRRRSGGRTFLAGVNGLIAVGVGKARGDVRRERHRPNAVENVIHVGKRAAVVVKANQAVALVGDVGHGRTEQTVPEREFHANAGALSGTHQGLPNVGGALTEQKQLDLRVLPARHTAVKTGGNDFGIIDDEDVVRAQVIAEVKKMPMRDAAVGAIQYHQAGGVPRLDGCLRNAFFGQVVVEIRGFEVGFRFFVENGVVHFGSFRRVSA